MSPHILEQLSLSLIPSFLSTLNLKTRLPWSLPKTADLTFPDFCLVFRGNMENTEQTKPGPGMKIDKYPDLPITLKRRQIIKAIKNHKVVIISGETGSGKTTQIPKFCIEAGRGRKKMIGCTQPRRIAAINVAKRIAEELNQPLGRSVGYKIRFDDKTRARTMIKIMTDGILLAETQKDRSLAAYDTIIVDEAHERSLNIDFTLGILRTLIKRRKDLRLIITSATIDTQKFSQAFDNAPVIEVSGRTYPVETIYMPVSKENEDTKAAEDQDYVEAAARAVDFIMSKPGPGDILIFMPTEQDISDTIELIRGRQYSRTIVLPLFARLSAKDQSRIFSKYQGRKIIVSTNVAETSLTIPGIKYVVDTGLARIPRYSPRTGTTALPVSAVSRSSANQRAGRCGRVENGICIRLFDEKEFAGRPFFTAPEILRANLAEVILRMISLRLGDISKFAFVDPPAPKSIKDGFDTLTELGAIKKAKKGKHHVLTKTGRIMAQLPIDPRLSRILIQADRNGCLNEAAIIVSGLAIPDPRQRPAEKLQAAAQKHALFRTPDSDFITLLNIWNAFKDSGKKSRSSLKKFCRDHFLSFRRMREWTDIHRQISRILKEHGINCEKKTLLAGDALYEALHKALLAGYISRIAHRKQGSIFTAAKGQQAMIFPGSGLFKTAGNWIVAAEFVKTSRLFARTAASIKPEWIEETAPELCSRTYFDPHWEKGKGSVVALEQVSIFGLVIVGERKVLYGRINKEESFEIFIRHALVRGEIFQKFEFMEHNMKLIDQVETLEHKTRKKDILASEDDLCSFYRERLPEPFYDIRSFARFIKQQKNQDFLKMTLEDLQRSRVNDTRLAMFPDSLSTSQGRFTLEYKFCPGSECDGVTLKVPAGSAALVPGHAVEKLVPGLFEEKIAALIKALPKKYRIKLVPVSEKAKIIAHQMPDDNRPLFSMLSSFIKDRFGFVIPATAWSDKNLPDHLKMRISITDHRGREIRAARDRSVLKDFRSDSEQTRNMAFEAAKKRFERSPVKTWDFSDLEESIVIAQDNGWQLRAFIGLKIEDSSSGKEKILSLRLFRDEDTAINSHCRGIGRLFQLSYPEHFKALEKDIAASHEIRQISPMFGGSAKFRRAIYRLILRQFFEKNIRTGKEFEDHGRNQIPRLYSDGQKILDMVIRTGKQYHSCMDLITKLCFRHQNRKKTYEMLTGLLKELKNLIPENFADLYTPERIQDICRFAECIQARAQKTVENPMKQEKKNLKFLHYTKALNLQIEQLTPDTSREKSEKIQQFFWMIEEYKISLFVPKIKTRIKVSEKKLDQFLIELTTML